MFSVCGIAGLWALQSAAARSELRAAHGSGTRQQTEEQHKLHALPAADASSPAKHRAQNLSQTVKDGAIVCFKDRRGQIAVVQPFGTGRTQWQLAVTCASGGCWQLSGGDASLQYVAADATFLVCQVEGNKFAFRSLGAEGRYLAATRDLHEALVIEHQRITQAAQWRLTSSGLSNVQFSHKRLSYTVHELKAVPVEAIAVMERMYNVQLRGYSDQIAQADAASRSLDRQLQEVTAQLKAARQEHAETAESLTRRWQAADQRAHTLQQEAGVRDQGVIKLTGYLDKLKLQHEKQERELLAAYETVAQLQQQLGDLEQGAEQKHSALQEVLAKEVASHAAHVTKLHQEHSRRTQQMSASHEADKKDWMELRGQLECGLRLKDNELEDMTSKVHRLDAALREVQRLMCGNTRRQRVDRASLDAVSIQQLQLAVAQFAAGAEGHMEPDAVSSSQHESQAMYKLLASQNLSQGSSIGDCTEDHQLDYCQHQQQHHTGHLGVDRRHSYDVGDLGWTADQSPGRTQLQGALSFHYGPSRPGPADSSDAHDSPLMKLAASTNGALQRGSVGSSPGTVRRQQGQGGLDDRVAQNSRTGHGAAVPAHGAGWLAAAAAAGLRDAGANSWPTSGTSGRQHSHHAGSSSGSRACALVGELSNWGTEVAVSANSLRADSSMASSEHAHRYTCSEQSDADSNSQSAGDDYQPDVDDLDAIHSVGQSLDDHAIRKLITSSSNVSDVGRQQHDELADSAKRGLQQQSMQQHLRLSGGYGRQSLTPVEEEQTDDQVHTTSPAALTMNSLRHRMH